MQSRKQKSPDVAHTIYATLEDFYFGKERQLRVIRDTICNRCSTSDPVVSAYNSVFGNIASDSVCRFCKGTKAVRKTFLARIQITPGMQPTSKRFPNLGEQHEDKEPGDLIVHIEQKLHPQFT